MVVLNWAQFGLPGDMCHVWRQFGVPELGGLEGEGATGTQWVEGWMLLTFPQCTGRAPEQNDPAQHVNKWQR